jgi:phage gp29-like protein
MSESTYPGLRQLTAEGLGGWLSRDELRALLAERDDLAAEMQTLRKALGQIAWDLCDVIDDPAERRWSAIHWLTSGPWNSPARGLTPEQADACIEAAQRAD